MEQAARQKVAEMKTTRDSEKNQSTALKAILQAKESNEIQGIYGRLGDLGAIDGKMYSLSLPRLQSLPQGSSRWQFGQEWQATPTGSIAMTEANATGGARA